MQALLRKVTPGLAIAAASALAVTGCGSSSSGGSGSSGSTMNIGVIYPFTGANADQGGIGMAGCLAGVGEVNAAGGVLGQKFVCKAFDTKGDPADATSAANQMMASASPVMVIGASDDAVTTAPIVTAANVPNFATIGDPHFDHQTNQYFYRITPSDALQGVALGYWAANHFQRPAAVFTSDLGAQTSVPPMRSEITKLTHKMVADVTLAPGQSSYRTEIAKIIAAKPDAIISEMDPQSAATFLSEYQQLAGHLPIILGTQRTSNSDWIQAVLGGIGQASYTSSIKAITPYVPPTSPSHTVYATWLMKQSGKVKDPSQYLQHPYAIADYDAINITALAMVEAKSTSPTAYNKFITKVTAVTPGAVQVHSYAAGLAALKAGQQIQYLGAGGTLPFNQYHSAERAFSFDNYDPASKSMTPVTVIPGSVLNS
ncbi:MAG TPA: ABC transporter substrate-binding protein [Streptosporangiaceae bacterium]